MTHVALLQNGAFVSAGFMLVTFPSWRLPAGYQGTLVNYQGMLPGWLPDWLVPESDLSVVSHHPTGSELTP